MLFTRSGQRFLGIGSKNGSFFILDPASMNEITRRQMLPYNSNGDPFDAVDPIGGSSENRSGVMATAAVNNRDQTIFVPVGGYAQSDSIDRNTTPFMRAVDWRTLADAWPTSGTNPPKYSSVGATMYMRAGEAGMASPATVNDVVFMSTTSSGLYAYRATDGLHLRTLVLPGSPATAGSMGPAIYGQYVVAGFWSGDLRIFKLQP
jgi:outer membrane protein assembly factor BamB